MLAFTRFHSPIHRDWSIGRWKCRLVMKETELGLHISSGTLHWSHLLSANHYHHLAFPKPCIIALLMARINKSSFPTPLPSLTNSISNSTGTQLPPICHPSVLTTKLVSSMLISHLFTSSSVNYECSRDNIARGTLDNAGHVEWWQHYTNQLINGVEIHFKHDVTAIIIIALITFVVNHKCSQEGVGLVHQHALADRVE